MLLLLAHFVLVLGPLGLLALCALRLWGKIRTTKSAAMDLKDQATDLGTKVSELAGRVESAQVASRLAGSTG